MICNFYSSITQNKLFTNQKVNFVERKRRGKYYCFHGEESGPIAGPQNGTEWQYVNYLLRILMAEITNIVFCLFPCACYSCLGGLGGIFSILFPFKLQTFVTYSNFHKCTISHILLSSFGWKYHWKRWYIKFCVHTDQFSFQNEKIFQQKVANHIDHRLQWTLQIHCLNTARKCVNLIKIQQYTCMLLPK